MSTLSIAPLASPIPRVFTLQPVLRYFWVLFFCLLGGTSVASPYFDFSAQARKTYQLTVSLRIKEARSALDELRKKEPENYLSLYLEHCMDVVTILSGDNKSDYLLFKKKLLPRIDKISRGDRSSPYYLFCQAEMRLQGALLQGRFSDYLSGLNDVKQAYSLLEENERRFPDFVANKKSLGLLHTMVGSIPEEYRWTIKALAGMKGDVAEGERELAEVVQYARQHPDFVYGEEALVTYAFLLLYADNQKERAWNTIRSGTLDHRKNPLAAYVLAIIANRTGHNDDAVKYLETCASGDAYYPFPFRYFLLGTCKLCRLDSDANQPLELFLQKNKGQLGKMEALQKLAWQQLLLGNASGYRQYMDQILAKGEAKSDTDKAAQREAKSGEMPDPVLLKARLLFDGGYYQRAYDLLKSGGAAFASDQKKKLEYTYRLGRVAHEMGKTQEAVDYYTQTMDAGEKMPWYFACNAALQLGILYEDQKNIPKARLAYQRCIGIQPEEYADSLHARAKAGLNRLK